MEQQTNLNRLLQIKENLGVMTQEELTGSKVQAQLEELRSVLAQMQFETGVDKSRLANLAAFVDNRQSLDPMVRKVLLGLINKLVDNPTAAAKPAPDFQELMGKIPGLEAALSEVNNISEQNKLQSPKLGVMPDMASLMSKIPGLEAALNGLNNFEVLSPQPQAEETIVEVSSTEIRFDVTVDDKKEVEVPVSGTLLEDTISQETYVEETIVEETIDEETIVEEIIAQENIVEEITNEVIVAEEIIAERTFAAETVAAKNEIAATAAQVANIGFDTRELLGFFLQESAETIEKFTNGLLRLEKNGAEAELVNELFRSAHTLKGASGTMGYLSIVKITHLAEDVLDSLRQCKTKVSSEMIDVLLNVADRVRNILDDIQNGGEGNFEVEDLVARLENCLGKPKFVKAEPQTTSQNIVVPVFEPDEKAWNLIKELRSEGQIIYEAVVTFSPEIIMPAVRAVMVERRLERYARIVQTNPSSEELRTAKQLEFHILLGTNKDTSVLEQAILQVAEINGVTFKKFEGIELPVQAINVAQVVKEQSKVPELRPINTNKKEVAEVTAKPFSNQTIRVQTERLDDLLNLVGEMVITRTRLVDVGAELIGKGQDENLLNSLNDTTVYLGRLMNELQESVMAMRMVPIGQVFSRFPRLIRDLARKTGKEVELVCSGEETELDKTIIEEIGSPLMHILRNAIDHGIESAADRKAQGKPATGKITIEAFHEGSHIIIAVSDDGNGIDLAAVKHKAQVNGHINPSEELSDKDIARLIFLPGLSTAGQVTDVSGRGVGMDVVKKSLVNLGGLVDIDTAAGKGTTFTIRLPLTLAIIQALLVGVGNETYAIPLGSVLETLRINKADMRSVGGHAIIQLRGSTLPLISVQEHFGLPATEQKDGAVYVVVVGYGEKRLGLIVDDLKGQQEIVIKSLGEFLTNVPGFSGATIRGDGKVTLILDVGSLIQDHLSTGFKGA